MELILEWNRNHPHGQEKDRRFAAGSLLQRVYGWLKGMMAAALQRAAVLPFRKRADREAVNQLAKKYMEQYGNAVLRLAYSYLHNLQDAEDILQETLLKVLEARPEFESDSHEKAYLLKTASNLAKNRIDYNKRREADELNDELVAEEREDLTFVWEAVKSLPDTAREVIHLFYQEGYQMAEIAKILGRKESTVRSDLKRARGEGTPENHLEGGIRL